MVLASSGLPFRLPMLHPFLLSGGNERVPGKAQHTTSLVGHGRWQLPASPVGPEVLSVRCVCHKRMIDLLQTSPFSPKYPHFSYDTMSNSTVRQTDSSVYRNQPFAKAPVRAAL